MPDTPNRTGVSLREAVQGRNGDEDRRNRRAGTYSNICGRTFPKVP